VNYPFKPCFVRLIGITSQSTSTENLMCIDMNLNCRNKLVILKPEIEKTIGKHSVHYIHLVDNHQPAV